MAENMFKRYDSNKVRRWAVPAGTKSGDLVIVSGEVGVALAGAGGTTKTVALPDGTTLSGVSAAGIGNDTNQTSVATDGTWLYPVAGVTAGDTVATGPATDKGTRVYQVTATKALTLVDTGNVYVGRVDAGRIIGTVTPVQIGVPA